MQHLQKPGEGPRVEAPFVWCRARKFFLLNAVSYTQESPQLDYFHGRTHSFVHIGGWGCQEHSGVPSVRRPRQKKRGPISSPRSFGPHLQNRRQPSPPHRPSPRNLPVALRVTTCRAALRSSAGGCCLRSRGTPSSTNRAWASARSASAASQYPLSARPAADTPPEYPSRGNRES